MSEFSVFSLPYQNDLIQKYQQLRDLPGFVLLESQDMHRSRYDILTACPYEKLTLTRDDKDPAAFINRLRLALPSVRLPLDLPFQGGGIGFFSYDLAMRLAGLENSHQSAQSDFDLLAEIGLYDWAIIADHQKKIVSLLAVNQHPETLETVSLIQALWQGEQRASVPTAILSPFTPLINKMEYLQAFDCVQTALQKGRCYQVNLTQPFTADYKGDSWEIYKRIRLSNPVPFAAFIDTSQGQLISFSPERFIEMENRQLLTSPIKGTARRSSDNKEDEGLAIMLANSEKNRAENIMIVDMLRNDLSKIAQPGSVKVKHLCEIQSYTSVHHLVSNIEAQCLDAYHPLDVFLACFPGASITGAPKLEAMRMIAELEPFTRGPYCGSIGYFSAHGRFDSNIAIRTMVADENKLYLSAGGGIVIDSDSEEEYQECLTKIEALNKIG